MITLIQTIGAVLAWYCYRLIMTRLNPLQRTRNIKVKSARAAFTIFFLGLINIVLLNLQNTPLYNVTNLIHFATSWYFYRLVTCFAPVKKHILMRSSAELLLFLVAGSNIYTNDTASLLACLALFLGAMCFFEGHILQKLSTVLILYPIVISVNLTIDDLGVRLWGMSGRTSLMDTLLHTLFYGLRLLIWWGIYRLFRKHITNCDRLLTPRMWAVIDIICLAPLTAAASLILFNPSDNLLFNLNVYPTLIACVITSLGCIYLTGYIAVNVKAVLENQNYRLQQTYYQELEQNQQDTHKLRHDMNNHLTVIAGLLEQADLKEARSYLHNLSGRLMTGNRLFSRNHIVNAVLNAKYNLITKNQIDCFFHIEIDTMIAIDDISLCSIFANTMDNAIEASLLIPSADRRHIQARARYAGGYFSYEISNAKINPIRQAGSRFISGKSDWQAHGFGLNTVSEIVADYGGTIEVSHDDETFQVLILIGNV